MEKHHVENLSAIFQKNTEMENWRGITLYTLIVNEEVMQIPLHVTTVISKYSYILPRIKELVQGKTT